MTALAALAGLVAAAGLALAVSGLRKQPLPTEAERRGDFSQSGVTIYDPLTTRPDPANPTRPYETYFRMVASDALQAPFLAESARTTLPSDELVQPGRKQRSIRCHPLSW